MPDYSKSVIYTIRCRSDTNLIYVGSTIQPLSVRWGGHKLSCYNAKRKDHNMLLYKTIRESNWENWYIELYEEFPCENIQQLHKREGEVIRQIGNLNKEIAGRDRKEWCKENKEKLTEQQKQWREENKEKIKQWREENIEKIKQWRETNKEKIKQREKQYRETNKEKIAEKVRCECGSEVRRDGMNRHLRSKTHQEYLNKEKILS
eukprot:641366-Hanusia_phi.AAC.1